MAERTERAADVPEHSPWRDPRATPPAAAIGLLEKYAVTERIIKEAAAAEVRDKTAACAERRLKSGTDRATKVAAVAARKAARAKVVSKAAEVKEAQERAWKDDVARCLNDVDARPPTQIINTARAWLTANGLLTRLIADRGRRPRAAQMHSIGEAIGGGVYSIHEGLPWNWQAEADVNHRFWALVRALKVHGMSICLTNLTLSINLACST